MIIKNYHIKIHLPEQILKDSLKFMIKNILFFITSEEKISINKIFVKVIENTNISLKKEIEFLEQEI